MLSFNLQRTSAQLKITIYVLPLLFHLLLLHYKFWYSNKFEENRDDGSGLVYLDHCQVKSNRILGINSKELYSITIFSMLIFQPQKISILYEILLQTPLQDSFSTKY